MKSSSIFTLTHPQGDVRNYRAIDGSSGSHTCLGNVGYVQGSAWAMMAIVLAGHTESEAWQIVNLVDQQNVFFASVAVLGATSREHAANMALRTFNGDVGGAATANYYDVIDAPTFVLKRLLDLDSRAVYKARVTQEEITTLYQRLTNRPVTWDGDQLKSHSCGKRLVDDMVLNDYYSELTTKAQPEVIQAELLDGSEMGQYDAIVSQVTRLDALSNRILIAMGKAADEVKPVNVTKTDPFKKHGVVNVAQIFELSDGQTITIVYHNPDSTPSRLDAKDLLTSWKFMLNKRDVTAVLQPKSGKDLNINDLAKRMMKIAEANSARFKRNQEKKVEAEAALNELDVIEQEKRQLIADLEKEIAELEAQLDKPLGETVASATNGTITGSNQDPQIAKYNLTVNADGDIVNKQGEGFSSRSIAQRLMSNYNLEGYVPKRTAAGYVLHRFNDAHFKETGKIFIGNPQISDVVTTGTPRLIFERFGREFVVTEDDVMGRDRFETVDLISRLSIPAQGEGKDIFFFGSVMDAYRQTSKELDGMSIEDFNATKLAKTPESDFTTSALMASGEMDQPVDMRKKKAIQAQEDKKANLNAELDQLRDENGKLNPLSDNPMERVKAIDEMNFDELLNFEPEFVRFMHKNKSEDEIQKLIKDRQFHLIKRTAQNSTDPDYLKANQLLYPALKAQVDELMNDPDEALYTFKLEQLQKVKQLLQENGIVVEEPNATQAPESTRYDIKNPNPRRRKKSGLVRITKREDGLYDVMLQQGTVGGEYVGQVDGIKSWLATRMQSFSDAIDGVTSWEKVAKQLSLTSGEDLLGIEQFAEQEPDKPTVAEVAQDKRVLKGFKESANALIDEPNVRNISLGGKSYNNRAKALVDLALKMAELDNGHEALEIADELQYLLNQNSDLRKYSVMMPRLDRVTAGKVSNKVRRLNSALSEAGTSLKLVTSKDTITLAGDDKNFQRVPIYTGNASDDKPFYVLQADQAGAGQDYSTLIGAIVDYLNEDKSIERKIILFGHNSQVIDSATRQLSDPLKAQFQAIYDKAKKGQLEYNQKRTATTAASTGTGEPLDHGVLNVPLEKRGNGSLDSQIDKAMAEQAQADQNQREAKIAANKDLQDQAKAMFETLTNEEIQHYADKAGIALGEAKAELKGDAHFNPAKAISVYTALKDVVAKQAQGLEQPAAEPEQAVDPEVTEVNQDEQWLDQVIDGSVDLAALNMDDFEAVAMKYADDTSSPIYAKLEQALNQIMDAKMTKAKGVAA